MPTYKNSTSGDITVEGIRIAGNSTVAQSKIFTTLPAGITKTSDLPVIAGLLLDDTLTGNSGDTDTADLSAFQYAVSVKIDCVDGEADIYFNTDTSDKVVTLKDGEGLEMQVKDYFISSIIADCKEDSTVVRVKVMPEGVTSAVRFTGKVELDASGISIGSVKIEDGATTEKAIVNDADTARATSTNVLAVQNVDADGEVLDVTDIEDIKTAVELLDNTVATISSTEVNRVAIFGDDDSQITAFGSPSTIATFKSPSDFTATYTSTTTITLSSLPFTISDSSQVVYLRMVPSSGDATVYVNGSGGVTLTVNSRVITIAGAGTPFASGDVYEVGINAQQKAYDSSTDQNKVSVGNADYAHTTSVEHLVDETNEAAASYRKVIQADTYKHMCIHLKGSGGVTFTVWASNDDTADDSADTGWVDVSTTVLGAASLVDSEGIYFIDTAMMPERYMIKHVTSDSSNATDIWCKRY